MSSWKRLPIGLQFLILLLLSVLLGGVCAYQIGGAIYLSEIRNQARTVADMVDNVGTWASQYNGIWVKNDPKDGSFKVGNFLEREQANPDVVATPAPLPKGVLPNTSAVPAYATSAPVETGNLMAAYHRKNPALVQRELSDVTHASGSRATYRMTSDKFMNPNNAPNRFELMAIEVLRSTKEKEYSEVKDGNLLFARKLVASAACLKCHDTPEKAPAAVRTMYGTTNGFGYKQGELAGVISVTVPIAYTPFAVVSYFGWSTWAAIVAFILSALFILFYIQRAVIRPVRLLSNYSEQAAHSELSRELGNMRFDEDEYSSRNEVHKLSAAIKAMYQSIRLLRRESMGQNGNVTPL